MKTTDCPFCKEAIKPDAVKCKHCHSSVNPKNPDHKGTCPYCKEEINTEAIKCKHCKSKLGSSLAEGCECGEMPERQAYFAPRLGIREYGQGCYYDCVDEHVNHGDEFGNGLHRYCQNKCQVSMPPPRVLARW